MIDFDRNIYKKALQKWGRDAQVKVAIEEFAELIVELAKENRSINGTDRNKITNEMADAEIMLEQLKIVFANENEVGFEKVKKINRLLILLK